LSYLCTSIGEISIIADKNPRKVQAVMEAMMTMEKLDVAVLEKAYDTA
jgi:hypothetical protein